MYSFRSYFTVGKHDGKKFRWKKIRRKKLGESEFFFPLFGLRKVYKKNKDILLGEKKI